MRATTLIVRHRLRAFWTFGAKCFGCAAAVALLAANKCIDHANVYAGVR